MKKYTQLINENLDREYILHMIDMGFWIPNNNSYSKEQEKEMVELGGIRTVNKKGKHGWAFKSSEELKKAKKQVIKQSSIQGFKFGQGNLSAIPDSTGKFNKIK